MIHRPVECDVSAELRDPDFMHRNQGAHAIDQFQCNALQQAARGGWPLPAEGAEGGGRKEGGAAMARGCTTLS